MKIPARIGPILCCIALAHLHAVPPTEEKAGQRTVLLNSRYSDGKGFSGVCIKEQDNFDIFLRLANRAVGE